MTRSPLIDLVIQRASDEGNQVLEKWTGFTKAKLVYFMDKGMSEAIRNEFRDGSGLRYLSSATRDHHNPPHEGFEDDEYQTVISFPLSNSFGWAKR